jgi:prepilin-type N-terminal cleavage/methylation domain-containing protein
MMKSIRTGSIDGKRRRAGFTLIEMVTAAAIFSILGAMLFSMVRTGMTMWREGEVSRTRIERAVAVMDTIARELRMAFTENSPFCEEAEALFLCDFFDYDRDGNDTKETRVQRLFFTRINMEERENQRLRTAGDEPMGRLYFTLFEEEPALVEEEGTRTAGGLAEACFMSFAPRLRRGQEQDGTLILYRGYRSPIGGVDSFFAPGNLLEPRELEAQLLPVMEGVLHLEFRFWDQNTLSFDPETAGPRDMDGAGYTWDSTRAILPDDPRAAPNDFRFGRGEESLKDTTDDIFPQRVMITVVVEEPGSADDLPMLTDRLTEESARIPLDISRPFTRLREGDRFVRIDSEWISFSRVDGDELVVEKRGARNTVPVPHKAETRVHRGKVFSTVVEIASTKSCWNED